MSKICDLKRFSSLFTTFFSTLKHLLIFFFNLDIFHLLDWFEIYSHVFMMYHQCCFIDKFKIFNTKLNYHFKIWNTKKKTYFYTHEHKCTFPFMFGFFKQEVVGALWNPSFNYMNCGEALTTIDALVSSYRWNRMLGFPFKQPIGTCFVFIIPSSMCKYMWLIWTYVVPYMVKRYEVLSPTSLLQLEWRYYWVFFLLASSLYF